MAGYVWNLRNEDFISSLAIVELLYRACYDLFQKIVDKIFGSFEDLSAILTENSLNIKNLMRRYELYLQQNREGQLLKTHPAVKRIYEFWRQSITSTFLCIYIVSWKTKVPKSGLSSPQATGRWISLFAMVVRFLVCRWSVLWASINMRED